MGFQSLIMAAADLTDFWGLSNALKVVVLFIACPFTLYWINYLGVWVRRYFLRTCYLILTAEKYYGWVETVGGFLKIVLVVGSFTLMMALNRGGW